VSTVNGTIPRWADHKISDFEHGSISLIFSQKPQRSFADAVDRLECWFLWFEWRIRNGWGKAMLEGCHTLVFVIAPTQDDGHA